MKTIACLLTAALVVEVAPAAVTTKRSPNECAPADDICRAEILVARAKAETDPRRRAIDWNAACRAYLAAHSKSGKVEELCAARRSCEASLAIEGLSASTRTSLENARVRLEEREASAGRPACGKTTQKPQGREGPRVARAAAPKAEAPRVEAPPAWMSGAVGEVEVPKIAERAEAPVAGADVEAPRVAEADAVLAGDRARAIGQSEPQPLAGVEAAEETALLPVKGSTNVRPQESRAGRSGRGLVIAGGTALGVGLGLGALAAWAGSRATLAYDEGTKLHESVDGPPDAVQRARDEELAAEYRRMGAVALVSGIAGGVAVFSGAVLVGVGGRRLRQADAALLPAPGGLAMRVRF